MSQVTDILRGANLVDKGTEAGGSSEVQTKEEAGREMPIGI